MSDTIVSSVVDVVSVIVETVSSVIETENTTVQQVSNESFTNLVSETIETKIVSESVQGPPGPPGVAEEEMVYAKRVDWIDENTLYKGEAAPGALEDAQVWRVRRLIIDDGGDVTEQWAGGNAQFNKVWNDRSLLTYV